MVCKVYNSAIPDGAVFCPNCGAQVSNNYDDSASETSVLNQDDAQYRSWVEKRDENSERDVQNENDNQILAGVAEKETGKQVYSQNTFNANYNSESSSNTNPNYNDNGFSKSQVQFQQRVQYTDDTPSLKNSYIKYWQNTANYTGRTRRSDYWYVFLMNFIISLICTITVIGSPLAVIYSFACLPPTLSLIVRRLHDLGKEWYNIFIMLIPIAGPIIMLVWLCTDSQPGANKYGENPKNQ